MNRLLYIIIGVLCVMVSCKPQVPDGVIKPDKMEDILVDYHLARALAAQDNEVEGDRDYKQVLYTEAVFRKHGITKADFDSSMIYYYSRADRLNQMYRRVSDRLDKQALALGATEGAIGRYASLNPNGDTANVWTENLSYLLSPIPPRNLVEFEIEIDSTFRRGDSFLLQFMTDYVYQTGMKEGTAVMSITYEGDTVVTRNTHFTVSGINQLRFDGPADLLPTRLRGFFYLGGDNAATSTLRLLFLSSVQLIRFHRPGSTPEDGAKVSKTETKTLKENIKETTPDDQKPQRQKADSLAPADNRRRPGIEKASHRDPVG